MHDMASRSLTPGEIALAKSIFGEAIDYSKVRMVHRKWWPFHPRNAAMAPTGNIHFHPQGSTWSEDFSKEPLHTQGFFIHEMTHVWQAQTRGRFYLPLFRPPFARYRYTNGLEQQAEIVRHAFLAKNGVRIVAAPPPGLLPF